MTSSTLMALKAAGDVRSIEEKQASERLRDSLVLILSHLRSHGYVESAARLQAEAGQASFLSRRVSADNMCLGRILREHEEYHEMKFGRRPTYSRVADESSSSSSSTWHHELDGEAGNAGEGGGRGNSAAAWKKRAAAARRRRTMSCVVPPVDQGGTTTTTTITTTGESAVGGVQRTIERRLGVFPGEREDIARSARPFPALMPSTDLGAGACGEYGIRGGEGKGGGKGGASGGRTGGGSRSAACEGRAVRTDQAAREKEEPDGSTTKEDPGMKGTLDLRVTRLMPSRQPSYDTSVAASSLRPFLLGDDGGGDGGGDSNHDDVAHIVRPEDRIVKPLPSFGGDAELRSLASAIQRDIIQQSTGVSWDDIVELSEAKRLLREAVVVPLRYPQLFTGLLSPWRGILLYGPPGTGKTMLAKAVAEQSNTTFFNISASSIVSKFRGDSEKLVRVLFELARYHSPSTIFLDEIDSIMGHRGGSLLSGGGEGSEHEGSRRMKTELLIQMDGLARGSEHVFFLAASNLPWDLDPALLRRLEKRVLVPLPNKSSRKAMLEAHFSKHMPMSACSLDLERCADATEGYSGADIKLLCKEAAMRPVRRILFELERIESSERKTVSASKVTELLRMNPITAQDLEDSLKCSNPSTRSEFCSKYGKWANEFGSS